MDDDGEDTKLFEGTGGAKEYTEFIRSVRQYAFMQDRIRDDQWMADYASTRVTGDAGIWFEGLEEETQASWKLLRKALMDRYTAANTAAAPSANIPTPAAAASAPDRTEESAAGSVSSVVRSELPKSNPASNLIIPPVSVNTTTVGVIKRLGATRQRGLPVSRKLGLNPPKPEPSSRRISASSTASQPSKSLIVISDDDEEAVLVKRPAATKRKSQARFVDDEEEKEYADDANKRSRISKGAGAAEKGRKAIARVTKDLEGPSDEDIHMTDRDDRDQRDIKEEADDGEPSEHVLDTKPIRGMPKKSRKTMGTGAPKGKGRITNAPVGSNGKPKKRVMKSRIVEHGFLAESEDYSSYESDNDDDSDF